MEFKTYLAKPERVEATQLTEDRDIEVLEREFKPLEKENIKIVKAKKGDWVVSSTLCGRNNAEVYSNEYFAQNFTLSGNIIDKLKSEYSRMEGMQKHFKNTFLAELYILHSIKPSEEFKQLLDKLEEELAVCLKVFKPIIEALEEGKGEKSDE